MIESQIPDLTAVQLRDLLETDDSALHHGLLWVGLHADNFAAVAASNGGGGAERIG